MGNTQMSDSASYGYMKEQEAKERRETERKKALAGNLMRVLALEPELTINRLEVTHAALKQVKTKIVGTVEVHNEFERACEPLATVLKGINQGVA